MADLSTKPYLIRAIHAWCEDSGYRPYIAVVVDAQTQVPREFVRNGEIVLNVSAQATNRLRIGNELIEFEARFSGSVRAVSIPIENVSAIYAQETGHGMAFDVSRAPVADPSIPAVPESVRAERVPTKPRLVPTPTLSEPPAKGPRQGSARLAIQAPAEPIGDSAAAAPQAEVSTEPASPAPRKPARAPRRRKATTAVADAGGSALEKAPPATQAPAESESARDNAKTTDTGVRSIGLAEGSTSAGDSAQSERPSAPDPDSPSGPGKSPRSHLKRIK